MKALACSRYLMNGFSDGVLPLGLVLDDMSMCRDGAVRYIVW